MEPIPLPNPDEPLFSIEAIRKRFGWDKSRYYRLVREGRFPRPREIAGEKVYSQADLAAYFQLADRWYPGGFDPEQEESPVSPTTSAAPPPPKPRRGPDKDIAEQTG